jgi:glycine cleavage system aminomethyltransferase T
MKMKAEKKLTTTAGAPVGGLAQKRTEYITKDEVKRVCKEIGLKDWSALKEAAVTGAEAAKILKAVNVKNMPVPVKVFRHGLEVELEHGTRYDDANVTNNHPLVTGKIVLAHLKETMDYYERLEVAEIESDLLKAILSQDLKKIGAKYRELISAQSLLNKAVSAQFK